MFQTLADVTSTDWAPIMRESNAYQNQMADRLLDALRRLDGLMLGFPVSQLTHCLQTAARAERDNAPDELVLAALCHDVGKVLSIRNHAAIAAEMLRPYVAPDIYELLDAHQLFQLKYTAQHLAANGIACKAEARQQFVGKPWFETCAKFVDVWDAESFDAKYPTPALEHYEPLVRSLCAKPKYPTIG